MLNAFGMIQTAITTPQPFVKGDELNSQCQCQSLGAQEVSDVQMVVQFNVQLAPKLVMITLKFTVE